MRFYQVSFRLARSLVALAVSLVLFTSNCVLGFASISSATKNSGDSQTQTASPQSELRISSATASATAGGVMLHWTTNATVDNLGFNIYRITNGQRTRINRDIVLGAVVASRNLAMVRGGYSYAWFDAAGSADAIYVIESVNVAGAAKSHAPIRAVLGKTDAALEKTPNVVSRGGDSTDSTNTFETHYPAADSRELNVVSGALEDQWAIAGQSALKIAIKKDGWYRVTQTQMVAAGFNPTVDIRNLRLFVDGSEVAISTSQFMGLFGGGEYIEFFGRGLDTPTSDTRVYYLIAGTTPGKRVSGELQLDGPGGPDPTATPMQPVIPPLSPATPTSDGSVLRDPIFYGWRFGDFSIFGESLRPNNTPVASESKVKENSRVEKTTSQVVQPDYSQPNNSSSVFSKPVEEKPAERSGEKSARETAAIFAKATGAAVGRSLRASLSLAPLPVAKSKAGARANSRRKKGSKTTRKARSQRHHALAVDGFAPANFNSTVEFKQRINYIPNILNGEEENWYGRVLNFTIIDQTLTVTNLDSGAAQPATLDFALQGIMSPFASPHTVEVSLNSTLVATVNFDALEHAVRSVSIPISQIHDGANTVSFKKTSTGESCAIDYVRLTYPHAYKADSGSLKFNLRGTQTLKVDGFATSLVRLIDYTDSLAVKLFTPATESSPSGYAITVPTSDPPSKDQRLLLAIPEGQFDTPASLSLNQPSSLNLNSNAGNFLILSHKDFIPNLSSLTAQRTAQGFTVSVVNIEDVYDEFGYGVHGPESVRSFLQHAATNWATPPRYVLFVGDASLDPRNYFASPSGSADFLPTKIIDTVFNETCTDDWFTDFHGEPITNGPDGIADIPVGRLAVRTSGDANTIISKIVNFTPVQPESALLVADDPTNYYFNFEVANDEVQALLPGSMTVQRVNVRTEPSPAQAKANVIAGFNQGRALVNYTGHGSVDVWASSVIFTTADASALTNGTKLPFVVVMDCLNGYFHDPNLLSISEGLLKNPNGGAVAAFASSGLTFPDGQHEMSTRLYTLIYGGPPIALGDAIKDAKGNTQDIDVRRTWIYFGDPSLKIR